MAPIQLDDAAYATRVEAYKNVAVQMTFSKPSNSLEGTDADFVSDLNDALSKFSSAFNDIKNAMTMDADNLVALGDAIKAKDRQVAAMIEGN